MTCCTKACPRKEDTRSLQLGLKKLHPLSFFATANSPIDNTTNDLTCSTTLLCDNTDEASVSGPAREHETETEDINDDNTQNEVPDYYQENNQRWKSSAQR